MKRILFLLFCLLMPSIVTAQSTMLQGGPYRSGHVPMYIGQGNTQPVLQDSGPAGGGAVGLGLGELLMVARGTGTPPYAGQGTGPLGTNFCNYDAPLTNPAGYHFLCLSANAQGGGLIAYGAGGGAAELPLSINLNGVPYEFPFVLSGSGVLGPPTTVVDNMACWNNTQGTLLKDCGAPILGPVTSVTDGVALFSNAGGHLLKSGGKLPFVSVTDPVYGAVCDGVTDDSAAINAALASGNGLVVVGRNLVCRAASTIVIPSGTTLDLGNFIPGNPVGGSRILCDAGVDPCVQMGLGGDNGTTALKNGTITRAGGAPASSTVGILISDGYNIIIENVLADNHGACWRFVANPPFGISVKVNNGFTSRCVDVHIDIDTFPELYWVGGRIGANGIGDYVGTTFIRSRGGVPASGGGPNTIKFDSVQFNTGGVASVNYFWEFVDLTAPGLFDVGALFFVVVNSHIEGVSTAVIRSDASWNFLPALTMSETSIGGTPAPAMFALDANTIPWLWNLVGNYYGVSTFDLAPTNGIVGVNVMGGFIAGTTHLTGAGQSSMNITGTVHQGDFTLDGTWAAFNGLGQIYVAGAVPINTAAGRTLLQNAQQDESWSPLIAIGGSTAGITQVGIGSYQVENRIVTVEYNIQLSNKGASVGDVTIVGLPIQPASFAGGGAIPFYSDMTDIPGGLTVQGQALTNSAKVWRTGSFTTEVVPLTNVQLTNTSAIQGTFSYFWR